MKKLVITEGGCIGCGACVAMDGEHFDFNDEGLSIVISNDNLEDDSLLSVIDTCPTSAIAIVEDDSCSCVTCECENCKCENCKCENCECGCN